MLNKNPLSIRPEFIILFLTKLKTTNLKILLFAAVVLFEILTNINPVLAAEVNVDFSQPQGAFQKYNQYVNQMQRLKGPKDRQRVRDAGINQIHVFYAPKDVAISEGIYIWDGKKSDFYGDDSLVADVEITGAEPVVQIYSTMPDWLGLPYFNDNSAYPNPIWSWLKYDKMIEDILKHFKLEHPNITQIGLFEEPDSSLLKEDKNAHPYQWRAWGKGSGWLRYETTPVDLNGGEIYKEFYLHTSNVIKKFNSENSYNFKLIGPDVAAKSLTRLAHMQQFLYFVQDMRNQGMPLQLDGISWNQYGTSLADPTSMSLSSPSGFAKTIKNEMNSRGINNLPLYLYEWAPNYNINTLDANTAATAAALVAGIWENLMNTGLDIRPFFWALNDYGSISSSLLAPTFNVSKDPLQHDAINNILKTYPDGTIFPVYNVYKMMHMQKTTRYETKSVGTGIYSLASADSSGIALMISRVHTSEVINVNIKNLPDTFRSGPIHFEQYLVDAGNSNVLNGGVANQELKKIEDKTLDPLTNHTLTLSISAPFRGYSVSLIIMTPTGATPPSEVSAPTFSPDSGTYISAQNVTISTSPADATIYYTLDGSDPASSSTRAVYLSAIAVSDTTTIKAKGFKDGLSPSATVSATYTINLSGVAAPSFSPAAGIYTTAQNVTISTATTGAVIHYTKDGTIPTEASPIYSTPINISLNTSLKAGAWKAGMTPSNITSAAYTISDSVNLLVNPGFESETRPWTFFTNGIGTFGTTSPGYEGNNAAKLALSRPGTNIQLFQAGITLTPNTRYRLSFAAYSSSGKDLTVNLIKHDSPYTNYGLSFTPNLGTSWQVFTTEFTTKGFANNVNDGRLFFWFAPFAGAGDIYYIDNVKLETVSAPSLVATPVFSPAGGTYSSAQNVTISTTTTGAVIHYTKDGTTPTEASPIYSTPINISSNTNLKAGAWKTGMTPSNISSATYTINTLVNLAPNPGFETDPAVYYAHFGSGTFTWASDFKHAGAKSLKIVSSQPTGALARWVSKREKISATAGKTYAAYVWMKTNNVSQYGELLINFWDANLAYLNKYYISNHLTGTTGWSQLSVSGIAPANTKYIRAEFRLYGPGTIWIDNVELK